MRRILKVLLWMAIGYAALLYLDRAIRRDKECRVAFMNAGWILHAYFGHTDGEWPTSWDDLRAMPWEQGSENLAQRLENIEKHVAIDFTLRVEDIVAMERTEFVGIKPIKPCSHDYRANANLWESLKAKRRRQE